MTRLSPSAAKKAKWRPGKDRMIIGRVGAAHGIHGELRIIPMTDFPERFQGMKEVMVGDELLHIESCRYHKQDVMLKFREYPVREQAMQLTNHYLTVARSEAMPLPEGRYYECDIIGLQVTDEAGTDLGKVENILHTGANDVYVTHRPDGRELLIPALKAVVKVIDVPGGRMVVDMPEMVEDGTSHAD
ncbi:MAG: ribosome maturation factor RimM [Selenomonadaceae bacterium]|nr:ribosome maturation factor RimM [Selenomonadaceae bacterium]